MSPLYTRNFDLMVKFFICAIILAFGLTRMMKAARLPPEIGLAAELVQQAGGVAISHEGRVFVSFPARTAGPMLSVAEVDGNGSVHPFPDREWNGKNATPSERFVSVQSVHIDDADALWILDTGSPMRTGVVEGGAKLLKVNLARNRVVQTIRFNEEAAPKNAYLNEVRVDTRRGFAFVTDLSDGGLVVVDLQTSAARRVLPSAVSADAIAVDAGSGYLYYKSFDGEMLYRLRLEDLEAGMDDWSLAERIEGVTKTKPSDTLEFRNGIVYLTSVEGDAVAAHDLAGQGVDSNFSDPRAGWSDSRTPGAELSVFVIASQNRPQSGFAQREASRARGTYRISRLKVSAAIEADH